MAPLQTVAEYNKLKQEARQRREFIDRRTGVACPTCGQELHWVQGFYVTPAMYPHRKLARCPKCKTDAWLET